MSGSHNENEPGYRYHPNELYDYMVRRLFKNLLHKDDGYEIYFSKRGKEDRTAALKQALDKRGAIFCSMGYSKYSANDRLSPDSAWMWRAASSRLFLVVITALLRTS